MALVLDGPGYSLGALSCADAIKSFGATRNRQRADLVNELTFDCALAMDAVAIRPQGSI
jgi:hypothetical protein